MRVKIIVLGIIGILGMAVTSFAGTVCTHVDMDWISKQVPLPPDARIVLKQEQGPLCEVVLAIDGSLVPVYTGKDFLLAGKLFKEGSFITKTTLAGLADVAEEEQQKMIEKEALAKEKRKVFFKQNIKALEDLVSFSFKPGQAKDFLYVITDPNCSYCKQMMPELELVAMEAKLELRFIIYPVLGPQSLDMATQAICDDYSYGAYKEIGLAETTASCEKADKLIKATQTLLQSVNLSFVPIVVAGDGSWVVEGNDMCGVKTHLGLESEEGDKGSGEGCGSD